VLLKFHICTKQDKIMVLCTAEPGYNDIGLYDTSPIASDIPWQQLILHW